MNRLRQWLLQALSAPDEDNGAGRMVHGGNPRGIFDGLSYDMPLVMGEAQRQAWAGMDGLQRQAWLTESMGLYSTDFARQSFRFQFDTPQRSGADMPITPTTENPLEEWDNATRRMVLESCHAAYNRNPIAKASVDYTTAFAIGDGMSRTFKNSDVERVIEAFCAQPDNPVGELETAFCTDLQKDGELILRYFTQEDSGEVAVVPMKPWQLVEIEHEAGFFRRYERFCFNIDGETVEVPADEIEYEAINRPAYHMRGKPDLYVMLPWLRAHKEWLEDRARQNYWRGALLWLVSVDTNNPTTMAQVAARWAKPPAPGSVAVESARVQVSAATNSAAAGEASEDGRQLKLMAAVGKRLPEYMLADGENANLATSNKQELPALTTFGAYQKIMKRLWTNVFRRVIEAAIVAGTLPEEVVVQDADGDPLPNTETIKAVDAFEVEYEPLSSTDPAALAQALMSYVNGGLLDDQTAREEAGFNDQQVQKRLEAQHEKNMLGMASGMLPRPPTMRDEALEPDEDEDEPTPEETA